MQTLNIVTTRDILRNYKKVFDNVKKTKQPAIVVTKKKPQVAIVSLDDLGKLKQVENKQSTKALLDMAGIIPKGSGLPTDLSEKHDKYTWY
jgi:PHD/YefM family antitoxin component YafN of YafNO toxin-antitoxin module